MSRGHSEVFLPIWHNHAGECSSLDRSQDWQLSGSQPHQDLAANCVTESEGIPSAIPHLLTSIINSWNTVIRVVSRSGSRVKSKSSGCSGNQSGNKREKKGKKKKKGHDLNTLTIQKREHMEMLFTIEIFCNWPRNCYSYSCHHP